MVMVLQMTTTMGMEVGTGLSTAEAITEMGRATTTLGEQLQLLLLLEGVQLHQLLHLAKLCSTLVFTTFHGQIAEGHATH